MAIIKFTDRPYCPTPWAEFEKLHHQLESWPRFFFREGERLAGAAVFPALNITEDAANIYVNAEMPGVKPDDSEIYVEGDNLIIKGEKKAAEADKKNSYHRREIERGRFNRTITLPTKINADRVKARAVNGILHITLPKAEEAKPRKIKVNAT